MHNKKKNIQIMPNEFKGVIDGCNEQIKKANKVLGYPDENGKISPIIFTDDYDRLQSDISEKIGQLQVYIDSSKTESTREKYNAIVDVLKEKREEVISSRKEFYEQLKSNAVEIANNSKV